MKRHFSRLLPVLSGIIAIIGACLANTAFAHIKNEASQFPDIEFSDARFDIVMLVGAGVIPETAVFEPEALLSRFDLASWAGLAAGSAAGGENADTRQLAAVALKEGLVKSVEGDATYKEVSDVFFGGQFTDNQMQGTPTKAQAARFIASHLTTTPVGIALLRKRGLSLGPTGKISRIEIRGHDEEKAAAGSKHSQDAKGHMHERGPAGSGEYEDSANYITIGEQSLPMHAHARVANGPTDLLQWEGRMVRLSFVGSQAGVPVITYLEAEPQAAAAELPAQALPVTAQEEAAAEEPAKLRFYLVGLVAITAALALLLFFRRRRVS